LSVAGPTQEVDILLTQASVWVESIMDGPADGFP